jgi:hypothetical protein
MSHLTGIIEKLAIEGEESVRRFETGPRLRGGLEGFRLARNLTSIDEFDRMISERHQHERALKQRQVDSNTYWEYRYATVQLEYCRDILIAHEVIRGERHGPVSCRATIKYTEIFPN